MKKSKPEDTDLDPQEYQEGLFTHEIDADLPPDDFDEEAGSVDFDEQDEIRP